MLIDTHCHIDQFPSPEDVVRECEKRGLRVVAVTNLPSHFEIASQRLRGHKFVSAALGMHPLFAVDGIRELDAFKRMAHHSNYIGEIGLDFSHQGMASKIIQERVFDEVLSAIHDRPRFVTLHSRGAEADVLGGLRRHGIKAAVFHWFSGSIKVLEDVFAEGHFVSINPSMLSSASGKRVIEHSPKDRILVESDGPFTKVHDQVCTPSSVGLVYGNLAAHWNVSSETAAAYIQSNFESILGNIQSKFK
ncbi:MAG: TatD family hydrolase [Candidatus Sumerlaeia bacterium]|nr:TatD family hydrolase [Candidatus Sumerlaeia bacterium]